MSKNTSIYVTNDPLIGGYKFLIADGTTNKDIYTCSTTEGERVTGIILLNNSAANRYVVLYIHNGTTAYKLGAVQVLANSGTNGTIASTDGMSATLWPSITRDNAGNKYRLLANGWKIQAHMDVTVSADNDIEITVITEKFTA